MNKIFYVLCLLLLITSCSKTIDQGQFTIISNKNVDLSNVNITMKNRKQNVYGKSNFNTGFFSSNAPSLEEALDVAMNNSDADLLLNVRAKTFERRYPFDVDYGWIINGDAIKTKKY